MITSWQARVFGWWTILSPLTWALEIKYCSPLNTADGPGNSTQFQSNGLCYDYCLADYAFAINRNHHCWCSDYAPGDLLDLADCNLPCPGYGVESCGGQGIFAYQALPEHAPSGTIGGPSSTESTESTTSSTTETTSSTTSPQAPITPIISLETITGQVRTVTIMPSASTNSPSMDGVSSSKDSGGLGTGGAVGLAVGLVAAAGIVSLAVFFCMRQRRKRSSKNIPEAAADQDSVSTPGSSGNGTVPTRTMSEHSRFVLGTDGRNVVEAWEPDNASRSARRNSRLMPIDQRLDPFQALYMHAGKSGESVNSIQDNRDYSRRVQPNLPILRMTNPDVGTP